MEVEKFAVGFLVCVILCIIGKFISLFIGSLEEVEPNFEFGYFVVMNISLISLGICLTYIGYIKGVF